MGIKAQKSAREIHTLARNAANRLRGQASTAAKRLSFCKRLLGDSEGKPSAFRDFHDSLAQLTTDGRHYWIGTFYSLLLSPNDRRRKAAYFTPPHLADAIIELLTKEGFDLKTHTVIDPAAGGAAFLSTIAGRMLRADVPKVNVQKNLSGVEIDPGLAALSELLIGHRLDEKIGRGAIVGIGDSLRRKKFDTYDLVVANPPYGRIFQSELKPANWKAVCYSGHINKYALFAELCCKLSKEGGLIALVLPSSFVAGPLYDRLRAYLRNAGQVLVLGSVAGRHDVFADVAQDVSVLLLRKGQRHAQEKPVVFGRFEAVGGFKPTTALTLPTGEGEPWPVPARARGLSIGGHTIDAYGAKIRAGYFVWNRESERMYQRAYSKYYVPLVWAKNVKVGKFCTPKSKKSDSIDFVRFHESEVPIIRTNAIILQRTTNSAQKRRLVAARISPSVLRRWGGFVTENHTLVVTAKSLRTLNDLCLLLNSKAADQRYRQVSGTASVSVTLLRNLDLPHPAVLRECLETIPDAEKAIEMAYAKSIPATARKTA